MSCTCLYDEWRDRQNVKRIGEHNHEGNSARVEVTKIVNVMKEKAKSTENIPHKIVTDAFVGFHKWQLVSWPSLEALKKNIRNARREAHRPLSNPILLSDIIITKDFQTAHNDDNLSMSDKLTKKK